MKKVITCSHVTCHEWQCIVFSATSRFFFPTNNEFCFSKTGQSSKVYEVSRFWFSVTPIIVRYMIKGTAFYCIVKSSSSAMGYVGEGGGAGRVIPR